MDHKEHIIIAGAGAAGLMAASYLLRQDFNVTILEARERTGGRIHTLRNSEFLQPVELGVEFIHGDLPLTLQLLKDGKIEYVPVRGSMNQVENGEWNKQEDFAIRWDEIMEKMNMVREDVTLEQFLNKYFKGPAYERIRNSVLRFAGGFDLADPSTASVLSLRQEWMGEEGGQYRIVGGFDQLIELLSAECIRLGGRIITSSPVTEIQWKRRQVTVFAGENKLVADKLIVTVPLTVLSGNSIKCTPEITRQREAAKNIGFGNVIKLLLEFSEPFWENKKKNTGFMFSGERIPTWWTQAPSRYPLLTGWAGGPQSRSLEKHSDEKILSLALLSLSNIFTMPVPALSKMLKACRVINWQKEIYTKGAYSFGQLDSNAARHVLNKPVDDTIFFAGEACYMGTSPGTVEAALVSAKNTAEKIVAGKMA